MHFSFYAIQSEVSVENLQRSNRNLEQRLSLVQTELATTQAALTSTQTDYENYKVGTVKGILECSVRQHCMGRSVFTVC